ncbi:MAG TPA: Gx transporter family protein [Haloplasmataceae bacterium]
MGNKKTTEKMVFIAILVALSFVLGYVDNILSSFASTQGVRLGLANIVILTGIYYLRFREALLLVILKSLFTGLLFGHLQMFTISLSGTLLSFLVMYLLINKGKEVTSFVGISVAGGIAHNIGQVIALIFYNGFVVIFNLIWLIPFGFLTGIFVGYIVSILRKYLDKGQVFKTITTKTNNVGGDMSDENWQ